MNNENERAVLFGTLIETKEDKMQVRYLATTGEEVEAWIPNVAIEHKQETGDEVILLVSDCEYLNHPIRVATAYTCKPNTNEQQTISDMWLEGEDVDTVMNAVDIDEPAAHELDDDTDLEDDFDDSLPVATTNAAGFSVELADDLEDDATTADSDSSLEDDTTTDEGGKKKKAKSSYESAIAKAAKARKALYAGEDNEVMQAMNTEIGKALVGGKRHDDFAAWNFGAIALPTVAMVQDPTTGAITHVHYTHNGQPVNRILLNPNERDPDAAPTDIEHYGAVINPRLGQTYQHIDHRDWMIPFGDAVSTIDGVKYDRYCIKKGARGAMTIDLTEMATKTRKESAEKLSSYLHLDANFSSAILAEENGTHRCGVTLLNPLDGKGAFTAHLTVMRPYCGNLAMRGANELMFKIRHTAGSIAAFDIEETAQKLHDAFDEAQKHLLAVHLLRHLPLEANMFDKMLTTFDKHGLIKQPSVAIDVNDYTKVINAEQKGVKLPKEQLEAMLHMGRGQAYKAVLHGWADPDVSYVKCETDSVGTAFHAMQTVSGMLSNSPIIVDEFKDRKTGKKKFRPLTGHKATSMEGFMKKSAKATNLFENIAENAVSAYLEHTGQDTLSADDMPDFKQYFLDNPSAIIVPNSSGKGVGTSLTEVPDYHDTWNMKVLTTEQKL